MTSNLMISVQWPLERFLRELSSGRPVPGGGAAAAAAGALGGALGSMVIRILLARPRGKSDRRFLEARLKTALSLSGRLTRLMKQDALGYAKLVKAVKRGRPAAQAAWGALKPPLEMLKITARLNELMREISPFTGSALGSDLKAAQALLRGSFLAASQMVRVNLKGLPRLRAGRVERQVKRLSRRML